jgi:hypothetical protein
MKMKMNQNTDASATPAISVEGACLDQDFYGFP